MQVFHFSASFQCLGDHSPVKVLELRKQREGIESVRETFRGLQDLVMKQEVFLVKVFLLQGLQACFLLSDTAVGTGEQHLAHRAGT